MQRFLMAIFAAALIATGSVSAQSATKPSCAPGDPVVWVNTNSGVYHMQGDRYYGTTKQGTYICKSAADAKNYRAASTHSKNGSTAKSPGTTSSGTTSSGATSSGMKSAGTAPLTATSPSAMASPTTKHHRRYHQGTTAGTATGTTTGATTAPAAALPTATATPAAKHHRNRHKTTPGTAASATPAAVPT